MAIGWKDDVDDLSNVLTSRKESKVQDSADKRSEQERGSNRVEPVNNLSAVSGVPSAHQNKNVIIVGIIALLLLLIIVLVVVQRSKENNPDAIQFDGDSYSMQTSEYVPEDNVANDSAAETVTVNDDTTQSDNPNAIYDERGDLISENGVYDLDGNIISDDEDLISVGLPDFSQAGSKTTAIVYSDTDYIKDLNGIDVPAVYNVKSRDYINDFANYEAKRAIIDDGMELYWLDLTYNGKKYRTQVPFATFSSLDKTGICAVTVEVLTLEGGAKIISYMQVLTDYSALGDK